jgi:plasmid stabilization system protein ParE
VLARARHDLDDILTYVAERSPEGAARLLASFEKSLVMLEKNPFLSPMALESEELKEQVRHIIRGEKPNSVSPFRGSGVVAGRGPRALPWADS